MSAAHDRFLVGEYLALSVSWTLTLSRTHHEVILVCLLRFTVLKDSFSYKLLHISSLQLLGYFQVLILQVTLQTDEVRAHGTIFTILKRVLVVIENLGISLSDMLSKHGYHFVSRLVIEG